MDKNLVSIDPFFVECIELLKVPGIETLFTFLDGEDAILRVLYLNDNIKTPLDLANELHISKGRVAQLVKSLSKKKYIRTKINLLDRRKVEITITNLGLNYLNEKFDAATTFINGIRNKIGEETITQLVEFIRHARMLLKEDDTNGKEHD